MPPLSLIDSAYRRALLAARDRNHRLNRAGVERVYRAFARLLNELTDTDSDLPLTPERAERIRQELELLLARLQVELVRTTDATMSATLSDLVEIHREVTAGLFQRFGVPASATGMYAGVPARALAALASRPNAATYRTLYRRKLQALAPELDTLLDASITKGVSVSRTRKDIARLLSRDDPRLTNLLDRYDDREFDFRARGLDESDAKAIRTLLYDARRIAVSEPNNVFREANAAALEESPIVLAAQWQLSARHHVPDVCDMLATQDVHGYGPGFYPPSAWPIAGHPFCGCYQGEVKFRPPSEWADPKPPPRPLEVDPMAPELSARWADDWTENERERNRQVFAAVIREGQRSRTRRGVA